MQAGFALLISAAYGMGQVRGGGVVLRNMPQVGPENAAAGYLVLSSIEVYPRLNDAIHELGRLERANGRFDWL
jgi:hypothetical protein